MGEKGATAKSRYEFCKKTRNVFSEGFTEAKRPWLPVNPNYYKLNVETQKKIPTSNYNFYKKMAALRRTDTLKYGDLRTYNVTEDVYIIQRLATIGRRLR